ncbi:MAG: hypothetical protein WCB48_03240, partial [Casimicrobiaceae bacterium]
MDHRVGVPEVFAERLVDGDPGHFLAADPVHHDQLVDVDRFGQRLFGDAQSLECVERVRAELDSGADFAECLRALEDGDAKAGARKTDRGSDTSDAPRRQRRSCAHQLLLASETSLHESGRRGPG